MPLEVFDYRRDIKNVVIAPEIRARFLQIEPGTVNTPHSHDLGAEVFLILQGQAEFDIDGESAVLGPGELCFAARDQMHQIRVVGDEPVIMYLSVTPHVEPTHTLYADDGSRLPPTYGHATHAERADHDPSAGKSTVELASDHLQAAQTLARLASESAARHVARTREVEQKTEAGDGAGAKETVDAMWRDAYATLSAVARVEATWNELAVRVDPS